MANETEGLARLRRSRLAWRQDAAARLEVYVGLLNSGLIGEPGQVRVSLIMPTLAMLGNDDDDEHLERCALCGEPIPWGAKIAAVSDDEEGAGTRHACATCLPQHAIYTNDGIDIDAAIAKAKAALSRSEAPEGERGQ